MTTTDADSKIDELALFAACLQPKMKMTEFTPTLFCFVAVTTGYELTSEEIRLSLKRLEGAGFIECLVKGGRRDDLDAYFIASTPLGYQANEALNSPAN